MYYDEKSSIVVTQSCQPAKLAYFPTFLHTTSFSETVQNSSVRLQS